MTHWLVLSINPDPWAIGPVGVGKKNGKYFPYVGRNNQLHDYKEAVKEALGEVLPLPIGKYSLTFYFWRRLDSHESGKKHEADATNLQKALEDALQGNLIGNDRDVSEIRSVIMEQSETAEPCIIIRAEPFTAVDPTEIPDHVWEQVDRVELPKIFDNTWMGPDA